MCLRSIFLERKDLNLVKEVYILFKGDREVNSMNGKIYKLKNGNVVVELHAFTAEELYNLNKQVEEYRLEPILYETKMPATTRSEGEIVYDRYKIVNYPNTTAIAQRCII